ncbi:site-specific integrase [Microbacterium sp. NFH-22A-Y]|uniref:tyrosine-type recombinase/integrase n=1 Tax=Microbacterium sp. NFH-22A-Y TaxID=2744448 RepID=UPI001F1AE522|nr:site-specific integrase [Microbacterium sp. NFH-22A-Y]
MAALTLHQAADDFLASHPPRTAARYRFELRTFLTWCDMCHLSLWDVRRVHIESFGRWCIDVRGISVSTASNYVGTVCRLFRYAHDEGIIPADPGRLVNRGGRRRYAAGNWLTASQLRTLLDAPAHPDVHAAICLTALSGLRIGEAIVLTVDDVTTVSEHVCVRLANRKYVPGGQLLALPPRTITAVTALTSKRTTGLLLRIPSHGGGPPIARGERERRDISRLRWELARLCVQHDLPRITPHALRRTFITLARDAGVSDRDIMASAGWTDPRMLTYYDRASFAITRDAGTQLSTWLDSTDVGGAP